MKTPKNELKNVFVMKLNAQSLNSKKTILHSAKRILSRKLTHELIARITSSQQ